MLRKAGTLLSQLKSPQSALNRNGNLRHSPPAAPRLRAPLPQNESGCFEKWDIAPNGFQTPQKFIWKQGIVKSGRWGWRDSCKRSGSADSFCFCWMFILSHINSLCLNRRVYIFSAAGALFRHLRSTFSPFSLGVTNANWVVTSAWSFLNATFFTNRLDIDNVS